MSRPKHLRKIGNPPGYKGFSPMGVTTGQQPVVFNLEEYEAIRLSDFDLHSQVEAAKIMGVSRPTFARIYEAARRKVAQAFVEARPLVFEGGKVYFDSDWYLCHICGCRFNHPDKEKQITGCALCGSSEIEQLKDDKN